VLQVHGYFIISAAISIPFNLIIIAALLGKGTDIIFLGYVTTIGWFLQFLVQVPVLVKEKYRFHWRLDFHEEHTVNMFRQLVPILLGNALLQLCLIIDRTFATNLEKGTAAALAFGSNLFITITSVFIVAMSTVVFPRLSQYCLERDHAGTRSLLNLAFKILLFILLPYLILVVAYHREIITLVYQRGAFTAYSTSMTSLAFLLYSLAVPGYACQELFNRVFYALKKFKVPALASVFCLVIKLLADWFSYRWAGIAGISISTSFCLLLYAVIMSFMVRKEIGSFLSRDLARFCCKLAFPALAMVSVVWGGEYIINSSSRFIFLIPLLLGAGAYLGLACLLGMRRDFATREV
jgi:putative peptidoglycan lipid II flippase